MCIRDRGTDTWYANLGPNHPLYQASEVTMEQLLPHPFVRLPDDYFSNLSFYLEIDGVRLEQFLSLIHISSVLADIDCQPVLPTHWYI